MNTIIKRVKFIITTLVLCFITMFSLAGCDVTYSAASEFYWSDDAGASYGNRTKEYEVGENVYMQLIVRVESSQKAQEEVTVTLTIPYVKDVVSKYMDGQVITPEVDELNQITTYNFTVIACKDAKETNFVFRFVPTKATDITLTLIFDDKISPSYDKQNTITFVEPEINPGE